MHRPVEVKETSAGAVIKCLCGYTTSTYRWVDDAWDEYDQHTMKE
jgi:hypothetical protein